MVKYIVSLPPCEGELEKFAYQLNIALQNKKLTIDNTVDALRLLMPKYIRGEL